MNTSTKLQTTIQDIKLLDRLMIARPVTVVRRTRRAYLGALGLSYDFAVARAERRRGQITELFCELVSRGETLETDAKVMFERAKQDARELTGTAANAVKDVAEDIVETAQDVQQEMAVTTQTPTKTAKRTKTVKTTKTIKTTKPSASQDRYAPFAKRVLSYDANADLAVVKRIFDHLGVALQSRDTKFVACSDEAERKTVAESWLTKKLGLDAEADTLDAKVMAVCETMKADRMKDRVTFYYLLAKNEGKLASL